MTTFGGPTTESKPGSSPQGRRGKAYAPPISLDKMFERPPPHSAMAEMALLGALILEPKAVHDVISVIKTPDLFFLEAHGAIYAALVKLYDQKQAGNLVLLAEALDGAEQLKDVGGLRYLEKLAAETPGPATALHFAKIVADKAKLRRLIDAGGQIVYDAYHAGDLGPDGAREIIDKAETIIFQIAEDEETGDAQPLSVLVEQEYERLRALQGKGVSGLPTGFDDLTELTSGLQGGEMIIVAARPSMGKTAFMLNLAEQVARGGVPPEKPTARLTPVGIFSLEMSKSAIAQRMLSARSGHSSHDMRSGRLSEEQYQQVDMACLDLAELPIFIDDTPGLTVLALRTRARRLVAQHGAKCILIDYLQLMTAPGAGKESRQVEVSAISRGVKALARELDVPVICLSQLNRGPEARGDNRPRMSDLRESGSIEQDADVVMLLHREAYYHVGDRQWEEENADKMNLAEIIIAKQRNGPTDVVKLIWDQRTTRFRNMAAYPGGTGLSHGYAASPSHHAPSHQAGPRAGASAAYASQPDPFKIEVVPFAPGRAPTGAPGPQNDPFGGPTAPGGHSPFAPGKKTGPIPDHRDGGGPDRDDDDEGGLPI